VKKGEGMVEGRGEERGGGGGEGSMEGVEEGERRVGKKGREGGWWRNRGREVVVGGSERPSNVTWQAGKKRGRHLHFSLLSKEEGCRRNLIGQP